VKTLGTILLRQDESASLQAQLCAQLKHRIQHSDLLVGERLPSSRALSAQLQVSRNTVVAAYEILISEGYLEAKRRSGVYVGRAAQAFTHHSPLQHIRSRKSPLPNASGANLRFRPPVPFRPAQPDVQLFPLKEWNRHRNRILKCGANILHYQSVFSPGLDRLRMAIAEYLQDSRGVRCDWRQIAITSGSQQALFLLALLLVRPKAPVYMEDPGYLGARFALKNAGARIVPLPIDEEGIQLPETDARSISLIYVTPSRQFPMGTCMSLARRLSLLQSAARLRTWIVEDDYDSEFRYSSPPLPSLQNLDGNHRVIYIGSFSKILFPALRLGYVVLPPPLVERFTHLKHVADDHGPLVDQATLAAFMESGRFYTHLQRCRRRYAERQQCFLEEIGKYDLPLRFPITDGGMNLTGLLTDGSKDHQWSEQFRRQGLDIAPLSRYAISHRRNGILFGFTAFEPRAIRLGLEKLAKIMLKPAAVR
jgi:GntR family transcriptional regulator/MocR family aminotransferase